MDFGESTQPHSIRELLRQQVKEQSRVCDVTVKYGTWVFHNNFQERHYGAVELHIGSPRTMDMAIMYLYGICPKLNKKNIAKVLDLAEFFLLPNLKMLCFTWLQNVELSEMNVVDILHLCSMYGLNIPGVELFIEQRLFTLLQGDLLLTLSPDSVASVFSDQRLSYVPLDLKLQFISRWIRQRQNTRMDQVSKLLALIDIPQMILEQRQQSNHQENFLITVGGLKLLAYSFTARQWYNLQIPAKFKIIEFYKENASIEECKIITYNDEENILKLYYLEKNQSKHIAVEFFEPILKTVSSKLVLKNGICYLIQTEFNKSSCRNQSTLLMDNITHICDEAHLNPVLFFKRHVLKWCVNSSNLFAILCFADIHVRTKTYDQNFKLNLQVYDPSSSIRFDVKHLVEGNQYEVELYGLEQGVAVVNGYHISIIRPHHDSSGIARFSMMHIEGEWDNKYAFIDKKCYRYSCHKLEESNISSFLEHYAVPTKWRTIAMPKGLPFDTTSFKNLAHISLRKTTLKCHFNCPHCKLLREEEDKKCELEDESLDLKTCKDSSTDSETDDDFLEQYLNNN